MVERETKLNEEEKKKYAEFLAKDYFTRSDFNELSTFYADGGAYDRLSTEGKANMSDRIQHGIERGEFSHDELPSNVRKKDAEFKGLPPETKRKEDRKEASPQSKTDEFRTESATSIDRKISAGRSGGNETNASAQTSKFPASAGLAGLANLSPVTEADEVNIPQLRRSGGVPELGG